MAAFAVVSALTVADDRPDLRWWEPWTWELSSGAALLALLWLPWLALRRAPPDGRWGRFAAVHAGAALLFSALHVAGFLALRHLAYAAAGEAYRYGSLAREFPYELRKDLLAYGLAASTFWLIGRLRSPAPAGAAGTIDIRDGGRLWRVPAADVLAVSSAGNYVEFHLADGRRPLMRSALGALERELAPHGFVRTHRSWLINAGRVTGLRPEGSGDYAIELGALEAPLSRRFSEALARLRAGPL